MTTSTKQVTELLDRYARGAREAVTDAQSGGLLGGRPATRGEILGRALGRNGEAPKGVVARTAAEAWADRVIKEGRQRLSAGLDPELLAAYAVKGAALLERGVRGAAEWAREMVREFGEAIRPYLDQVRRHAEDRLGMAELKPGEALETKTVPTTRVAGGKFEAPTTGLARKRAAEWAREHVRGTIRNEDTGWDIRIGPNGIDKALSGQRDFPQDHLEAIAALPKLLATAIRVVSRPDRHGDPNIKAIHRFYAPLEVGDRLYRVKLTVKETLEGKYFYDHSLTKFERPAGIVVDDTAHAAARQTSTAGPEVKLSDLLSGVKWAEGTEGMTGGLPQAAATPRTDDSSRPGSPRPSAEDNVGTPGPDVKRRAFSEKVEASPDVSDEVKAGLTQRFYEPRSNETDAAAARRIVEERGADAATLAYQDERNGMPEAVRTALGLQVIQTLGVQERMAWAAGDRIAADEAVMKAVAVVDHAAVRATNVAQALQAFAMWARLTPAGHLRAYRQVIEQAGAKVMDRLKPAIQNVVDVLGKVNAPALEETLGNAEVQRTARAAVNERLTESPATHQAVVVEVAGGLGESPEVLRQVQEKVRGLFAEGLREARQKGLWPRYQGSAVAGLVKGVEEALAGGRPGRASLDEFTKTVTGVLREQLNAVLGVKPGEPMPGRTYLQRLMDALSNAEKVQEVWSATRAELARRFPDDARIQRLPALAEAFSPKLLRGVIGEEMRALGVSVAEVAAGHYRGEELGRTLRDKIMARTGMAEQGATRLAQALDAEFARMVALEKGKLAQRIAAQRAVEDLRRQSRSVWDREKEAASRRLLEAVKGRLAKGASAEAQTALQAFTGRLVARLRRQLLQSMPERASAVSKLTDLQLLREAATNAEHYQEVWRQAQAEIRAEFSRDRTALKALDGVLGKVAPELFDEGMVDRALRQQLRAAQVDLGKVVRSHFMAQAELAHSLAQRLAQEAGLSGKAAERLAAVVEGRFRALATARKEAELKRLALPRQLRPGARTGAAARLIELSNLGALSQEKAYNAVREKLKLPTWDPDVAKEIVRRANELPTTPEGFQQQRKVIDLQNYIARQTPFPWWDLPMSFWYAHVLSGPTTHLLNTVGNLCNLAPLVGLELGKAIVRGDIGAIPGAVAALAEGARKGGREAAAVLKSGMVTGTRLTKLEASRGLELRELKGWARPFRAWRYVGRALAAEDLLFFKSAEELRSAMAARRVARGEGLRGEALQQRVADILGNFEAKEIAARARAQREGLTGLDYRRRVGEILEQGRPEAIREDARDYALRATFNQMPEGVLGYVAQLINQFTGRYWVGKLVVPFTHIVANIANESLNYSPVGGVRAAVGWWTGSLHGKPLTGEQLADQTAKAVLGTVGLAALYGLHAQGVIEITGNGPTSPEARKQLMETGWTPYAVRIGKTYYGLREPALIPVGVLGCFLDALKYRKLDQTDALNRAWFALESAAGVLTSQSYLSGLAGMFDWLQARSTKSAGEGSLKSVVRTGASFVVPNLVRQIDQLFDPTVYDKKGIEAMVVSSVPFVRRLNRPALNALGEPVTQQVLSRFMSQRGADELWQTLADKQAWVPVPSRDQVIGDRKRGPDYYRMMTPDEYYDFIKESGQRIRLRLGANLGRLQAYDSPRAKELVQQIADEEHKRAKERFRR